MAWSTGAQQMIFFCFIFPVVLFDRTGISICQKVVSVESSSLPLIVLRCDLFVYRDDSLTSLRVIMQTEQPTCLTNGDPWSVEQYHWKSEVKESDTRSTGVQLKSAEKLSTVIGLITKHADCRMTFRS